MNANHSIKEPNPGVNHNANHRVHRGLHGRFADIEAFGGVLGYQR